MKNHWLTNKIVAKGVPFWTFEILDEKQKFVVSETVIAIDEKPQIMVIEKIEVQENGMKVWKPVCIVWEEFEATYTDEKFLESHSHLRVLEANGDAVGILRMYDKTGEQSESWVMHGLKLTDIKFDSVPAVDVVKSMTCTFTFHHALYLTEENVWKKN
jgi:hypothetical protein